MFVKLFTTAILMTMMVMLTNCLYVFNVQHQPLDESTHIPEADIMIPADVNQEIPDNSLPPYDFSALLFSLSHAD